MNTTVIILNIISALAVIGWFAWETFEGFARAMGNAASTNSGDPSTTGRNFVIFVIILIAGIVLSHIDHSKRAIIWALVPVVLLAVYVITTTIQHNIAHRNFVEKAVMEASLAGDGMPKHVSKTKLDEE